MIIPGLPEMVEHSQNVFGDRYEREVNDLSSGIFNAFLGVGQGLAPLYGSMSMQSIGWRLTTDVVAIVCLTFAVVYYVLGGGYEAFSKTIENFKEKPSDLTEPLIEEKADSAKAKRPTNLKVDIETRSFITYY